jgi:hypothetical protein
MGSLLRFTDGGIEKSLEDSGLLEEVEMWIRDKVSSGFFRDWIWVSDFRLEFEFFTHIIQCRGDERKTGDLIIKR